MYPLNYSLINTLLLHQLNAYFSTSKKWRAINTHKFEKAENKDFEGCMR